jgi:hypothetical protein
MVQGSAAVDGMSDLARGIDALLVAEPVGDVAHGELLLGVLRERDRLEAAVLRLVRLAEAAGTAVGDGAAGMAAWLRWRGRLVPGEAACLVRTARRLPELPGVEKALVVGEISVRHARAVTDLLTDVPAEAVRLAEPVLVEIARGHDPRQVARAAARVREAAHPDGTAEARRRLAAGRCVTLTEGFGGSWDLTGRLTPDAAATLRTAGVSDLLCKGVGLIVEPRASRKGRRDDDQQRSDSRCVRCRAAWGGGC